MERKVTFQLEWIGFSFNAIVISFAVAFLIKKLVTYFGPTTRNYQRVVFLITVFVFKPEIIRKPFLKIVHVRNQLTIKFKFHRYYD